MARDVTSPPRLDRADNGVYYIYWTEQRRSKRVSTRSRNLVTAQEFFSEWLKLEREAKAAAGPDLTCEEAWDAWPRRDEPRNRTIWRALKPYFGDKPVRAVTQRDVEAYAGIRVNADVSMSTVWLEITKLKASWHHARARKLLTEVPEVKNFDPPPPRDRWLRKEEIEKLFAAAAELRRDGRLSRVERFLWLGLETAARHRAICALRWRQVDFDLELIDYTDGKPQRGLKKRRAVVPISTALMPVLRRMHEERKSEWVLDHSGDIGAAFDAVAEKAGFDDVTPHTLRHTAATWMMRNKAGAWATAGILANSVQMVEKVYGKHTLDGLREAVNSMGAAPKLSA